MKEKEYLQELLDLAESPVVATCEKRKYVDLIRQLYIILLNMKVGRNNVKEVIETVLGDLTNVMMDLFLLQHLHQCCLLKGKLLQIFMWPLNSKITKTQHCIMMKQANLARKQVLFRLLLETRPMQWVYLTKIQAHRKGYLILSKNA